MSAILSITPLFVLGLVLALVLATLVVRDVLARTRRPASIETQVAAIVAASRARFGHGLFAMDGTELDAEARRAARLGELATQLEALRSEITELDGLEEQTDEQSTRHDAALEEWTPLHEEFTRLTARAQRTDAIRDASLEVHNRERAGDSTRTGSDRRERDRQAPFADMASVRAGTVPLKELRGRALDAVELSERMDDDAKEHVTRLIEGRRENNRHVIGKITAAGIARHVLETGSDDYHDAFEQYLADPASYGARAAMSLTPANGGYLVPFTLDPTLILTNSGSANPIRRLSNIKTTTTNTWNGVTSAGVNAGWLAEGAEVGDNSPTFGNLQITPQKAAAWLFGNYELLEDSDIASELPGLLADAKDRLEEAAFTVGDGVGKPFGVVPRAITVSSASVATLAAADPYNVQAALPARFRGPLARNAWLANLAIIQRLRQFDTAGGSAFWANLGMDQPEKMLGAEMCESTSMASTITTGSKNLLLGDFKQYFIVDRIGMSVLYEPLIKGANQRPTGQAGWFAFWRTGGDVATSNAFRVLQEQ